MKYLITYFFLLFAIFKANASTIDSLLVKEYNRGYEVVREIIENNCLKDSLIDRPFCSLFFENLWTIAVKTEKSYVVYYGYRIGSDKMAHMEISSDDNILIRLFSLEQNRIERPVYKLTDFYSPFYWYFVSVDSSHNKQFEWNAYSKSDDKYAKVSLSIIADFYVYLMYIMHN